MAPVTISTSELLDALQEATGDTDPTDALTLLELRGLIGWGRDRITKHLLKLKASGRLQVVFVKRERLDGNMVKVPAYRFVKGKKVKP